MHLNQYACFHLFLVIGLFVTVCISCRANLCAVSSSVRLVQTQSHDFHHQPQHCPKEVSLHDNGSNSQVTGGQILFLFCCVSLASLLLSVLILSVSVRLLFRSWALDGLILLLSDSKQMDFVVLRLKEGRVMMSADLGKGPASVTSSVTVNDGEWHTVSDSD